MSEICSLFKEITSYHSPSGEEYRLRNYLKGKLRNYADKVEEDALGNLLLFKYAHYSKDAETVMLIAHMDEVAMMVTHIDERGLIGVTKVGGVDANTMRGQRVIILHEDNNVYGVVGTMPVHMLKDSGAPKEIDFKDLWVDIGVSNVELAKQRVAVGDYVLVDSGFCQLSDNCVCSKACDNKAGVTTLCCLFEKISKSKNLEVNVVVVFSAQEEVGLRGAEVAAFNIKPSICITIDEAHASDYPNICHNKYGDIRVGNGPVIPIGTSFSSQVQKSIMKVAQDSGIPFQRLALPAFSGTEATAVQTSGSGCLTGLVTIPCRYMHSPVEVVSTDDIMNCGDLLYKYITQYRSIV